ncbi:MAG TPA: hypothetical protein VHT75_10060 [Acidimicrobiales bacterium]|nr:hypothetical protein [Acidimicrobiales bacterium]
MAVLVVFAGGVGAAVARQGSGPTRVVTTGAAQGSSAIGQGVVTAAAGHAGGSTTTTTTTVTTPPTGATAAPTAPSVPATRSTADGVAATTTTTITPPTTSPVNGANPDQLGLYLANADTGAVSPVVLHYTFETVSFSPDGSQLVFAGRSGDGPPQGIIPTRLWIVNRDGSGLHQVAVDTQYPENPSWSPDGRSIAYYAMPVNNNQDEALYLLDPTTGTHRMLGYVDQARFPLEWSPDSTRIALAAPNDGGIEVVDAATGAVTKASVPARPVTNGVDNLLNEVSWTRDGRHLVASYFTGTVGVTDASGNGLQVINPDARYARASPVGDQVSEWVDYSAYLQPLDGAAPRLLSSGMDPIDWSRDGQLIAGQRGTRTVDVVDVATGLSHHVVQDTHWDASPAGWSPVGHTMAVILEQSDSRRY